MTLGVSDRKSRELILEEGNRCALDMFTISRIVTENSIYKLSELIDMDTSGNETLAAHKETEVNKLSYTHHSLRRRPNILCCSFKPF